MHVVKQLIGSRLRKSLDGDIELVLRSRCLIAWFLDTGMSVEVVGDAAKAIPPAW